VAADGIPATTTAAAAAATTPTAAAAAATTTAAAAAAATTTTAPRRRNHARRGHELILATAATGASFPQPPIPFFASVNSSVMFIYTLTSAMYF